MRYLSAKIDVHIAQSVVLLTLQGSIVCCLNGVSLLLGKLILTVCVCMKFSLRDNSSTSSSFVSSVGVADDEALTRLLQTFLCFRCFAIPRSFDRFLLQILCPIVHPDSSCKSFLVSCQAVTNPLPLGWVLTDIFRPRCPSKAFSLG